MRRAKSSAELGFNRYDQGGLPKALKRAGDKRTFPRVHGGLLGAHGRALPAVARMAGVSLHPVYTWVTGDRAAPQLSALLDAPRRGRPRPAPAGSAARLLREVRRKPLRLGYRTTVGTGPVRTPYLSRRYHCPLSSYTLRRRMRAWGLPGQRPRDLSEEQEPHRAQKKGLLGAA